MKLEDKPESHINLAKKAVDACHDAGANNGSKLKAENLTIELIEANRPYMDEAALVRAEMTISAIRCGKVRFDGSQFDSIQEEKPRNYAQ